MSDLIKRQDAIATIGVMYERCDTHDIIDYRDLMLEAVKVLPSVDRPQGEWVRYMGDIWTCSACGESLMCDDIECNNYCPNCGARMKGADDEAN